MRMQITDGGDLRRLARDLRKQADGKELRKNFSREIRAQVKPIQAEVRSNYKSGPAWGGEYHRPGGSLRKMLARGVQIRVNLSGKRSVVSIFVSGKKLPTGMKGLPRLYEGVRPWRHPVFGSSGWSAQTGDPAFTKVVPKMRRKAAKGISKIADRYARQIAKRR